MLARCFGLPPFAVLTHPCFLLSCPADSLNRLLEFPKEIPRTWLALARTTVWCCVGVPLRLLASWMMAVTRVVRGDEAGWRARAAVRRTGEMMTHDAALLPSFLPIFFLGRYLSPSFESQPRSHCPLWPFFATSIGRLVLLDHHPLCLKF